MFFRIAGKDVHIPKLIGAFVLIAALLMFIASVAGMFESWENITDVQDCLQNAKLEPSFISQCQEKSVNSTGIYVRAGQGEMTLKQMTQALLPPISIMFFWLAVLVLGGLFYKSGNVVIPIEEKVKNISDKKIKQKRKR